MAALAWRLCRVSAALGTWHQAQPSSSLAVRQHNPCAASTHRALSAAWQVIDSQSHKHPPFPEAQREGRALTQVLGSENALAAPHSTCEHHLLRGTSLALLSAFRHFPFLSPEVVQFSQSDFHLHTHLHSVAMGKTQLDRECIRGELESGLHSCEDDWALVFVWHVRQFHTWKCPSKPAFLSLFKHFICSNAPHLLLTASLRLIFVFVILFIAVLHLL